MNVHDVVVVGAGPAGLSAAAALLRAGVRDVLVLERERFAGGVPRHCRHRGFGVSQFGWPYTGPAYAERLRRDAAGAELRTGATVIALHAGGGVSIASEQGTEQVRGRCVVLSTGIRETPRAARLVSGDRPWGVLTTGALQQFVHLAGRKPCRRAVVVGSEWVSLSALWTMRRAGITPVALLEEADRVTVPRLAAVLGAIGMRTPVFTRVRQLRVSGREVVERVEFERDGTRHVLHCDAVVFSGRFVPEAALVHRGHLALDPGTGGPIIDQHWRCSDPCFFAAGNVLRAVETAGVAGREGAAAGHAVARALGGCLPVAAARVHVALRGPLRYVYPQVIACPGDTPGPLLVRTRVLRETRGELLVRRNGRTVWHRDLRALPERRIELPRRHMAPEGLETLEIALEEAATAATSEVLAGGDELPQHEPAVARDAGRASPDEAAMEENRS